MRCHEFYGLEQSAEAAVGRSAVPLETLLSAVMLRHERSFCCLSSFDHHTLNKSIKQ